MRNRETTERVEATGTTETTERAETTIYTEKLLLITHSSLLIIKLIPDFVVVSSVSFVPAVSKNLLLIN